jgi:hypothetical protein
MFLADRQIVPTFKSFQLFPPPIYFFPRDAGEDEEGGLNGASRASD